VSPGGPTPRTFVLANAARLETWESAERVFNNLQVYRTKEQAKALSGATNKMGISRNSEKGMIEVSDGEAGVAIQCPRRDVKGRNRFTRERVGVGWEWGGREAH
jgi:hypothetical protein